MNERPRYEKQTSNRSNASDEVTWEEFFGTSTADLVPSLLNMYDTMFSKQAAPSLNNDRMNDDDAKRAAYVPKQTFLSTYRGYLADKNSRHKITNSNQRPQITDQNPRQLIADENPGKKIADENPGQKNADENPRQTDPQSSHGKNASFLYKITHVDGKTRRDPVDTNIPSEQKRHPPPMTSRTHMAPTNKTLCDHSSNNCDTRRSNINATKSCSCAYCQAKLTQDRDARPLPVFSQVHFTNFNLMDAKGKSSTLPTDLLKYRDAGVESKVDGSSVNSTRPVSMASITSSSSSASLSSASFMMKFKDESSVMASAESLLDDDVTNSVATTLDNCSLASMNGVEKVLNEIIETETIYVADIREVIQGYLKEWSKDRKFPLFDYIPVLFNNIEDIYAFNSKFLNELRQCGLNAREISKVFVRNDGGFDVYTQYCTKYPETMALLTQLMNDKNHLAEHFRAKQLQLKHALPIGSYLLKPVQRILRYHLLLQNLLKECESADVADVELALSTMTNVACHINEMKRKHEHAIRVQEIQSLLYGWSGPDLTTFGELCAEGVFRVHGAKAHRHAFLFDRMLLIAKSKDDGILCYKMHIMCSNLMLIESVQGDALSFHVIPFDNPRQQCTLQAKNLDHKRQWTMQLKRAILENFPAVIPTHARQLVMELGQCQTNQHERSNRKQQYSAPEYLQKRHKHIDRNRRKSDLDRSNDTDGDVATPSNRLKELNAFLKMGSWRRRSDDHTDEDLDKGKLERLTETVESGLKSVRVKAMKKNATFYVDPETTPTDDPVTETREESREIVEIPAVEVSREENVEEIVSQLIMQNRRFHKIFKKQKSALRVRMNATKPDDERAKVVRKLNLKDDPKLVHTDETNTPEDENLRDYLIYENLRELVHDSFDSRHDDAFEITLSSPSETSKPDVIYDVPRKIHDKPVDVSIATYDTPKSPTIHPEYKIYRAFTLKTDDAAKRSSIITRSYSKSLLQRFKDIIAEDETNGQYTDKQPTPSYKQGSPSLGARISQSEYASPNDFAAIENQLINRVLLKDVVGMRVDTGIDSCTDTRVGTLTNTGEDTLTNTPEDTLTNPRVGTQTHSRVGTLTNTCVGTLTHSRVDTHTDTSVGTHTDISVGTHTDASVDTHTRVDDERPDSLFSNSSLSSTGSDVTLNGVTKDRDSAIFSDHEIKKDDAMKIDNGKIVRRRKPYVAPCKPKTAPPPPPVRRVDNVDAIRAIANNIKTSYQRDMNKKRGHVDRLESGGEHVVEAVNVFQNKVQYFQNGFNESNVVRGVDTLDSTLPTKGWVKQVVNKFQ